MNNLPIFVRVRSQYEGDSKKTNPPKAYETSAYRLGVTSCTLVPSLKNQTCKDFTLILLQNEDDRKFAQRTRYFSKACSQILVFDDPIQTPHILVEVGDDDFLGPQFIENIRNHRINYWNTTLQFPNGYIFYEKKLSVWRDRPDLVSVEMIVEPGKAVHSESICSDQPSWIYVRHQMNTIQIPYKMINGLEIKNLSWPGWSQSLVATHCSIALKTGSAVGCVNYPRASASIVHAGEQSKKRRKMKF